MSFSFAVFSARGRRLQGKEKGNLCLEKLQSAGWLLCQRPALSCFVCRLDMIEPGHLRQVACAYAGNAADSLNRWLSRLL